MQINISAIREQKGAQLPIDGQSPAPPLEASGGAAACGPVRVRGSVTNVGKGFLVKAHLSCEAELECTRCLTGFTHPLERDMQEMYYPERLRLERPEGEDVANWFSGDVLDLSEAIRENLQLAIPMKRLCRPDCKGICLTCGRNLNEGPCDCRQDEPDERWAPLKGLLLQSGQRRRGGEKQ